MLILNNNFGRLGNNIIQLNNIISIALEYKHNIKINIKIQFFDLSVIEEYFNRYNNSEIIESNFYNQFELPFPYEIFKKNREEVNKILRKAFLINNINKLPENDIVIHIRSGDIFSSNPHPSYLPPPLSYYTKEIDKCKYEKIHIVCEDTKNPVVNELLKLYKNAVYKKNTLEKDIKMVLGATNIIMSCGSFVRQLKRFSDNLKLFHLDFYKTKPYQEYKKIMYPWKNTKEQRDYILTF